ncbi:MAG TPA: retropepsin-like aspartic protease [Mucilaginibacter sp.]|jgi:predicted aspartyl protease
MKPHYFICYLTAFIFLVGCTNKSGSISAAGDKKLHDLLDNKEYFKLETQVKLYNDSLGDEKKLYYTAYLDNVFNRNLDCINDVDKLLKDFSPQLPDSMKLQLGRLQSDSYFKTFQYAKAAKNDIEILKKYAKGLTKNVIDDIKNDILMRGALKNTAPQQTVIKNNTTISWKHDMLGLIEIPVKCNADTFSAIFDTRANISTITKTYAKKLGLHILDVSYNEGSGATGIQFKSGMGVADSLRIGDVLVKNVVFQVMPDSILYIAPVKFQLNIIIGFPVIAQMQEVHIFKNGTMTIPQTPTKTDLHNFALDGLDPVIALKTGNDTLDFHFDSGASTSMFYVAYLNKYRATVTKVSKTKLVGFGGAGGIDKKMVYVLPKVDLTLAGKTVIIDSVDVLQKKIVPEEKFYGNIGQDFVNQFNELIYNFNYMYIKGN